MDSSVAYEWSGNSSHNRNRRLLKCRSSTTASIVAENRVAFSYSIGDIEYLDSPWIDADGKFVHECHPGRSASAENTDRRRTGPVASGAADPHCPRRGRPYAVDTVELPYDNPWKVPLFCGDHDFLPDGSALVCTIQGDVWRVTGLDSGTGTPGVADWRRFASGLHHALGLVVADGKIYVQCRDQMTRLTDLNEDGEADFYECFSNAFVTSPADDLILRPAVRQIRQLLHRIRQSGAGSDFS